jgi:hypothetical protein
LGIQLKYDIWGISEKLMLPPKLTGFWEWLYLLSFKWNWYIVAYMQAKAAELAGILEGKTLFYVKIETPNDRESIDEIMLERQQGIACRVEGAG